MLARQSHTNHFPAVLHATSKEFFRFLVHEVDVAAIHAASQQNAVCFFSLSGRRIPSLRCRRNRSYRLSNLLVFSREGRMTRPVGREGTWQCNPDSQLHSTGVRFMLQVGPEIHIGNSG